MRPHSLSDGTLCAANVVGCAGKPYVLSAVGTFAIQPLGSRVHGWLHRRAFQNAQAVACISAYTERRLTARIPLENTQVVPLGVDVACFASDEIAAGEC